MKDWLVVKIEVLVEEEVVCVSVSATVSVGFALMGAHAPSRENRRSKTRSDRYSKYPMLIRYWVELYSTKSYEWSASSALPTVSDCVYALTSDV